MRRIGICTVLLCAVVLLGSHIIVTAADAGDDYCCGVVVCADGFDVILPSSESITAGIGNPNNQIWPCTCGLRFIMNEHYEIVGEYWFDCGHPR